MTLTLRAFLARAAISVAIPIGLSAQQAAKPDTSAGTVLSGDVYDSVAVSPVSDAMVQLVSQQNAAVSFTTTSDSTGRYRIAHVPPGKYLLGFLDETLSELGLTSVERIVDVGSAPVDHLTLAIPSAAAMHDRICGPDAPGDSSGVMVGFVRDAASGTPIGRSSVVAVWRQVAIDEKGLHSDRREVPAKTSQAGWFALCGLPSNRALEARAEFGGRATGFIEVKMPGRGLLVQDFDLGAERVAASASSNASSPLGEPLRHGTARLIGTVADSTGRLLEGAHVTLWGSTTATTNADGRFVLDSLPSGTNTVESQFIGFAPVRNVVDLAPGRTDTLRLIMSKDVRVLASVNVTSKLGLMRYNEFEQRRKTGTGHYYTSGDVMKNKPEYLSDFLYSVPGIRVVPVNGSDFEIVSAHGGGLDGPCNPAVWLNNVPLHEGGLNQLVLPEDVVGIEVYDAANTPQRYRSGECGVVLIWSK